MTVLAVALGITPGCLATRLRPKQSNRRLKHTFTPTPCQALPIGRLRDQIDARLRRWQLTQTPIQIKIRRWRQSLLRLLGGLLIRLSGFFTCLALLDGVGGFLSALLSQFDARLRRLRLSQSSYTQVLRGRFDGRKCCAQDDFHLAQRRFGIIGDGSGIDADFAGHGVTLPIRAALDALGGRTGVLPTNGRVRLLVGAHLAVTLHEIGDFQLLLALLLGAWLGLACRCR